VPCIQNKFSSCLFCSLAKEMACDFSNYLSSKSTLHMTHLGCTVADCLWKVISNAFVYSTMLKAK
jgi:hypothetical protein